MEEDAVGDVLAEGVLALNKYYVPIRVVTARRAFGLLYTAHAEVIDIDAGERFNGFTFDAWVDLSQRLNGSAVDFRHVQTPRFEVLVPRIIRLLNYDRVPRREVKFSRKNILSRDSYRCQYCGKRLAATALSIDHVVPKSRGGRSAWTNVVAACARCNTRKGDATPHEAGMKLLKVPAVPTRNPMGPDRIERERHRIWNIFLKDETFVDS